LRIRRYLRNLQNYFCYPGYSLTTICVICETIFDYPGCDLAGVCETCETPTRPVISFTFFVTVANLAYTSHTLLIVFPRARGHADLTPSHEIHFTHRRSCLPDYVRPANLVTRHAPDGSITFRLAATNAKDLRLPGAGECQRITTSSLSPLVVTPMRFRIPATEDQVYAPGTPRLSQRGD